MAEVRVLGPFQAIGPRGSTTLTSSRQRALIGLLALSSAAPVSVAKLVSGIWGEDAPRTAVRTLQSHVARARRSLADCGLADLLVVDRSGYRLLVDQQDVDAYRFEDRVRDARRLLAAGDVAGAAAGWGAALQLWCGEPLQGTDLSGWGAAEVSRLREARLAAIEDWCDALLRLGMHAQAEDELQRLRGAYPERERPAGLLMLARYRAGRHAEALAGYAELREQLADTLGIDPSPELQRLHTAMLCRDPNLDFVDPAHAMAADSPARTAPAAVPAPAA
ncbi:MAG TPA: AfsR/SARP family transcriptional regulator, partial [Actinoplanes sp.]|nr:AfsR/SARP family transcriptional regulator [Actinoplanes sp.]